MATANTPLFPDMPPEARCWIYTATEPMSAATQKAFLKRRRSLRTGPHMGALCTVTRSSAVTDL